MKSSLKSIISIILYIVCLSVLIPQIVFADDSIPNIPFSYVVKRPENQRSDAGYFDLRMQPAQKQTVEIELFNATEKEVVVELELNSAKTNSNGVIEYGPSKIKKDKSMKYDITEIASIPKEVKIAAKGSAIVPIVITMPTDKFDGYISGGIQMMKKDTEKEKKERANTEGVVNRYAFTVGLLLSETDTVVQPQLVFNQIGAALSNYRNAFLANFSNTQATYIENMSVDVQIFKGKSDEVLYETKREKLRMAPNSMIDFPITLNGEKFESGKYQAHILVKSGEHKWEWTEEFDVTDEEADKYNGQDVSLIQERGVDVKLIAMIVGGVFFLFVIIFIIVRVISEKNKRKKKKRKKKN